MSKHLGRSILAAALIAATISTRQAGAALAAEGDGPSFPEHAATAHSRDRAEPTAIVSVEFGGVLPPNSGQGEPEPANSLPPRFLNGTSSMQRHRAFQQYRAGQAQQAARGGQPSSN